MKKVTLLLTSVSLLMMSCQDSTQKTNEKESQSIQTTQNLEQKETLFITKVTSAFHKILEDDSAWNSLYYVFEDHLMRSQITIKDVVLPYAYSTIKDDIMLPLPALEKVNFGNTSFGDRFTEEYQKLYGQKISLHDVKQQLPKLHFTIPKSALKNTKEWIKNGRPISAKGYQQNEDFLKKTNEKEVIEIIGDKNYQKLLEASKNNTSTYYYKQDKGATYVIALQENQGNLLTLKNKKATLESFEISNNEYFSTITINKGDERITGFRKGLIDQTWVNEPIGCKGFYVFDCNSQEARDFAAQKQALANEMCQDIWVCIPCCTDFGIIYATMVFKPEPLKCRKHNVAIEIISLLPDGWGNNT